MKIRQNDISKFDIAIYRKFRYFCRRCDTIRYIDIESIFRYFRYIDTALVVTCHWFCESCNNKVGLIFPNLVNLHERMNNNEKAIAKVEIEVEKNNGHIIKLKSDVNKISNELNGSDGH